MSEENINQLKIIEKYEDFVNYIYPICINIPKGGHVTLRNKMTDCIFTQIELFVVAGKTSQISKLYLADSGLSMLRFYLRFCVDSNRKLISQNQFKNASLRLDAVEIMLKDWIKTINRNRIVV